MAIDINELIKNPSRIKEFSKREVHDAFLNHVKRYAETALPFVKQALGLKMDLTIHVKYWHHENFSGGFGDDGDEGSMIILNCAHLSGANAMLEVLSHECIHAKQVERGDLVNIDRDSSMWQGEIYHHAGDATQADMPWEQEAYAEMFAVAKSAVALMKADAKERATA